MLPLLLLITSVIILILLTAKWHLHPFLALLFVALFFGIMSGMDLDTIIKSINDGFGNTIGKIGIVIALGVIIGAFLEYS